MKLGKVNVNELVHDIVDLVRQLHEDAIAYSCDDINEQYYTGMQNATEGVIEVLEDMLDKYIGEEWRENI